MLYHHSYNREQDLQPDLSLMQKVLVSAQAPCCDIMLWMSVHAWTCVYTH